jgi:transcriptional regulator with XRE-family HTH domain
MKPLKEGDPPPEDLGDRIGRLRRKRGWSQAELAERAGAQAHQISKYERGDYRPGLEMLSRIAEALETTTDFLITGQEPARDPRLRALLPKLEALPRELRDILADLLESVVQAHLLVGLGRRARKRKLRSGGTMRENDRGTAATD